MYTLYYAPGSASLCVHWLLLELGIEFERGGSISTPASSAIRNT